jgi:hypothetical protein
MNIHTQDFGRRGNTIRFRPRQCTAEGLHPEPGDSHQLQKLSSIHLVPPASRAVSRFLCPTRSSAKRSVPGEKLQPAQLLYRQTFMPSSALSCRVLRRLTHRRDQAWRVGLRDAKMIRDSIGGRFTRALFVENRVYRG